MNVIKFMDEFNEQVDSLNNIIPEDFFEISDEESEISTEQGGNVIDNIYEQKSLPILRLWVQSYLSLLPERVQSPLTDTV